MIWFTEIEEKRFIFLLPPDKKCFRDTEIRGQLGDGDLRDKIFFKETQSINIKKEVCFT